MADLMLAEIEAAHVARKPGHLCGACHKFLPCPTSRLCRALRVALVLHAKHCGMEFCEAEAAILAELSK